MRILITGGSGFLGSQLVEALLRQGHEIILLTRKSPTEFGPTPYTVVTWPTADKAHENLILNCDAVINLAGESLANGRWTSSKKQKIERSRIHFTHDLIDVLAGSTKLHTFLSASAIGFYGHRKTEVLDESSHVGEGYLAEVCKMWEDAALALKRENLRTVLLRTGVVLGRGNGFLQEMEGLYKNHLGGVVGSGDQVLSWIHVEDWVRAVQFCLEKKSISGPVNLVAPEPINNRSFATLYSELIGSKLQMPAPEIAVRLALGEKAAIALDSQNVRPKVLTENLFKFNFPYLDKALIDLYDYEKQGHHVYEYFQDSTWLPYDIKKVFNFFSDAQNLPKITPPEMNFEVVKMSTSEMGTNTLIDYTLKVRGLPMKWRTQILDWEPPRRFTDTQLKGPYSRWHHTHTFESLAGGTLMKDTVHYQLPLGFLGRAFGVSMVRKDVGKIFEYRAVKILELFKS
jgi:uncharacterized protein (TIGR01777 family)